MNDVKDEIISFLVKKISVPNSKGSILALHGPKGTAKCLAAGTKVLLSTGERINVENVAVG